jgi:hypothetical protein
LFDRPRTRGHLDFLGSDPLEHFPLEPRDTLGGDHSGGDGLAVNESDVGVRLHERLHCCLETNCREHLEKLSDASGKFSLLQKGTLLLGIKQRLLEVLGRIEHRDCRTAQIGVTSR